VVTDSKSAICLQPDRVSPVEAALTCGGTLRIRTDEPRHLTGEHRELLSPDGRPRCHAQDDAGTMSREERAAPRDWRCTFLRFPRQARARMCSGSTFVMAQ
jgi:hypothetical protein